MRPQPNEARPVHRRTGGFEISTRVLDSVIGLHCRTDNLEMKKVDAAAGIEIEPSVITGSAACNDWFKFSARP